MSKGEKLTTVRKWEKELNIDLDYDVKNKKVICMRCKACKCWETRIKNKKKFLETWVRPGTKCIEKDSLKKHLINERPSQRSN